MTGPTTKVNTFLQIFPDIREVFMGDSLTIADGNILSVHKLTMLPVSTSGVKLLARLDLSFDRHVSASRLRRQRVVQHSRIASASIRVHWRYLTRTPFLSAHILRPASSRMSERIGTASAPPTVSRVPPAAGLLLPPPLRPAATQALSEAASVPRQGCLHPSALAQVPVSG